MRNLTMKLRIIVKISWVIFLSTGLSFEAGCRRKSTSTLYSVAGYFLCIEDKKCVIYSQSLYHDNDHVFFFHYQSLMVATIDLSIVNNASQTGRRVAIFHWPAKVCYPCMAWTIFIDPDYLPKLHNVETIINL